MMRKNKLALEGRGHWNKFGCVIAGNMKIHNIDIDGKSGDKRTKTNRHSRFGARLAAVAFLISRLL
jgi:hypothetical protein